MQLSLTAVQQLYGTSRVADNHALVTQIRSLMQQDALLHGTIQLYVSPEAFASVQEALGETLAAMGWELHRDASPLPGMPGGLPGCGSGRQHGNPLAGAVSAGARGALAMSQQLKVALRP